MLAGIALLGIGLASDIILVVAGSFLGGLCIGAALPAITAMLGLETPSVVRG